MNREELKKEAQEQVNYCTPLYPESFIQGYLAGAEPRENKIADIKANCDLAIEGRDVKIKELELELTVEKDLHQEETNLHLHAEDYIKSLEQKLEQTEKDLAISEHDREHNDYELVEVYKNVERLEKENAELKQDKKDLIFMRNAKADHIIELKDQLEKAKDLIEDMYDKIPASHSDYYKDVMERARQFLKEIEK